MSTLAAAEPSTRDTPLRRRRQALLIVVVGATMFAAGGLAAPLWIKSPQQLAAEAQPPAATTLTAPVERRLLRDVLVVRGDIRPGRSFAVTPQGSGGIVTATKVGRADTVSAGKVIAEISGRPLVVLPGGTPSFRDLEPGMTGKDVRQLQVALAGLGVDPGERDGVFGPGTKVALTRYYKSLGYEPLTVGSDSQVAELRRQMTGVERQVDDANDTVTALANDPSATQSQKDAAAKALARAREDLAAIRAELDALVRATGPMLPLAEYVFLPSFPAVVVDSRAVLGAPVSAPLITLSTGSPVVVATLTEAQRALCRLAAPVTISGDRNLSAQGTVATIGDRVAGGDSGAPGSSSAAVEGYPLTVATNPALDAHLVGQSVLLKIEVAATDAEQLVVPVSAIYGGADNVIYVLKSTSDGREVRVPVQPGLSAQGYVVVTVAGDALKAGDLVTIGGRP